MDVEGVDIQALSCVPFVMYPEVSAELGSTIARINNDALAAACARYPDRFVPLASVPLQDPPAAARELERAAQLGLRGVEIPQTCVGKGWMSLSLRCSGRRPRAYRWWSVSTHLTRRHRVCWRAMAWAIWWESV